MSRLSAAAATGLPPDSARSFSASFLLASSVLIPSLSSFGPVALLSLDLLSGVAAVVVVLC